MALKDVCVVELEETRVHYSVTEVGQCDTWAMLPSFLHLTDAQKHELKTTSMLTVTTEKYILSMSAVEMKVTNGHKN